MVPDWEDITHRLPFFCAVASTNALCYFVIFLELIKLRE